jgi:hypothetical protein
MRRAAGLPILLAILFAAAPAAAEEVYGRVWVAHGSPAGAATVSVECGNNPPVHAVTDANGAYRLTTNGSGPCAVHVQHGKHQDRPIQSSRIQIHVSGGRTRANLELTRQGAGWSLVRR